MNKEVEKIESDCWRVWLIYKRTHLYNVHFKPLAFFVNQTDAEKVIKALRADAPYNKYGQQYNPYLLTPKYLRDEPVDGHVYGLMERKPPYHGKLIDLFGNQYKAKIHLSATAVNQDMFYIKPFALT